MKTKIINESEKEVEFSLIPVGHMFKINDATWFKPDYRYGNYDIGHYAVRLHKGEHLDVRANVSHFTHDTKVTPIKEVTYKW